MEVRAALEPVIEVKRVPLYSTNERTIKSNAFFAIHLLKSRYLN